MKWNGMKSRDFRYFLNTHTHTHSTLRTEHRPSSNQPTHQFYDMHRVNLILFLFVYSEVSHTHTHTPMTALVMSWHNHKAVACIQIWIRTQSIQLQTTNFSIFVSFRSFLVITTIFFVWFFFLLSSRGVLHIANKAYINWQNFASHTHAHSGTLTWEACILYL